MRARRPRRSGSGACGATASGKFRTKGKHSAATVVGTKWLVEDRCKIDAHARGPRPCLRPRLRQEEDGHRPQGQAVHRARQGLTRPSVQIDLTRDRCSKTIASSLDARSAHSTGCRGGSCGADRARGSHRCLGTDFGVFTVDKTADEFDGECTADCTLREAVTLAGQSPGGGTPSISVPAGVYRLTRGALQLRTVLILGSGTAGGQGAGARTTIIDARGAEPRHRGPLREQRDPRRHDPDGAARRRTAAARTSPPAPS